MALCNRERLSALLSHLLNLGLVCLLVAVTLGVREGVLLGPRRIGFFCGDQSIRYGEKQKDRHTSSNNNKTSSSRSNNNNNTYSRKKHSSSNNSFKKVSNSMEVATAATNIAIYEKSR